jgi:hypothetical protein
MILINGIRTAITFYFPNVMFSLRGIDSITILFKRDKPQPDFYHVWSLLQNNKQLTFIN